MEYILTAIIGILLGIIINFFADILPGDSGLSMPTCASCQHPFSLKDYLYEYKCSHCGTRLPARNLLVILVSVAISFLLKFFPPALLGYWAALPVTALLGIIFVIDWNIMLSCWRPPVPASSSFSPMASSFSIGRNPSWGALGGLLITLAFYFSGSWFQRSWGPFERRNYQRLRLASVMSWPRRSLACWLAGRPSWASSSSPLSRLPWFP